MPSSHDHLAALNPVIETTIAPNAPEVDRTGTFPRANVEALAKAGLLGLASSVDVGGRGQGLRAAAEVIERLAGTCGSTAMVLQRIAIPRPRWHDSPARCFAISIRKR